MHHSSVYIYTDAEGERVSGLQRCGARAYLMTRGTTIQEEEQQMMGWCRVWLACLANSAELEWEQRKDQEKETQARYDELGKDDCHILLVL